MSKFGKKNRIISLAAIISITAGCLILVIGMSYYKYQLSKLKIQDLTNYPKYKYHYALITEEEDEPFWEAIYKGALDKGKEQNVYVEKMGNNLSVPYSMIDMMKIAITSKVDGIIIEPNGQEDVTELINQAEDAGIPVVTVLKDAPKSSRKSFIGINTYNQGQAYGKEIMDLVNEGKRKVTVMINSNNKDIMQNIIYSNIVDAVRYRKVKVDAVIVNTQSTFSSEEDIRKIIMDNPPDVLVCLTAVDTICAYQAVIDYNKVGDIDIIGYYDSDLILYAIDKNIIHSTMTIDAKKMGAYCVEALTEYKNTDMVSDYFSVDIGVIDKNNIQNYINKKKDKIVK